MNRFNFGMKRNYIDIKEALLKYEMYYIFCAIVDVYGNESFNKFISYVKKMYGLDPSYTWVDIIEVMADEEIILNISVFFDSEDERHISEIGIKDLGLDNLILCLKRNVPYKSKPTFSNITIKDAYTYGKKISKK